MAGFLCIDEELEKLDPELSRILGVDLNGKSNYLAEKEEQRQQSSLNESFKDTLLASLYSQIEFLRSELQEKNILIRALLIRGISNIGLPRNLDESVDENRDADWETTLSDSGLSSYSTVSSHKHVRKEVSTASGDVTQGNGSGVVANGVEILHKYLLEQLNEVKQLKQKVTVHESDTDSVRASEKLDLIPERPLSPKSMKSLSSSSSSSICSTTSSFTSSNSSSITKSGSKKRRSQSMRLSREVREGTTRPLVIKNNAHDNEIWEPGTHLIIGDNSILGIDEERMGKRVKVRGYPGAFIKDFYAHLTPLLQNNPTFVTLMTCFNDILNNDADKIFKDLIKVKEYVEAHLPECRVTISCPEARFGDERIRETTVKLRKRLQDLNILQF